MSDNKESVILVNGVTQTSNQSLHSQGLEDTNNTISTNSMLLLPDAPSALLVTLWKEIEPIDLFTEPFGTVNKYQETILFELPVQVCSIRTQNNFEVLDLQLSGEVTIIFYPDKGKVFIIVKRHKDFWSCAMKELSKNTKFDIDGCAVKMFNGLLRLYPGEIIRNERCYLFKVQDNVCITFSNDKDLIRFKTVIRDVQARISKNRLPTNDHPKKGNARVISEFWFQSALRPYNVKLLFLLNAFIWIKIEGSDPVTPADGILALAQYKVDKSLCMIIISENTKMNWKVSDDITFIASDISSDPETFVWEWFADYRSRNACAFKTVKAAYNFKLVFEYYLDAWKKRSLSWDW